MKDKPTMLTSLILVLTSLYLVAGTQIGGQMIALVNTLPVPLTVLACLLFCTVYILPLWIGIALGLEWLRNRFSL